MNSSELFGEYTDQVNNYGVETYVMHADGHTDNHSDGDALEEHSDAHTDED